MAVSPKPQIQFGAGYIFLQAIGGNTTANPTPVRPLTLQGFSCDISATSKELMGNLQFPDDVATSDKKLTGKFQFGQTDIGLYNELFFAETLSVGGVAAAILEPHTVPAVSTYTITVTQSATYTQDWGVTYNTGTRLQRVASGPTLGQYSVAAGVYTFAAADASAAILITYNYTLSSAGSSLIAHNQLQGYSPLIQILACQTYSKSSNAGVASTVMIYNARITKLSMDGKRDGYLIPEMDFEGFADPTGQVIGFYSAN